MWMFCGLDPKDVIPFPRSPRHFYANRIACARFPNRQVVDLDALHFLGKTGCHPFDRDFIPPFEVSFEVNHADAKIGVVMGHFSDESLFLGELGSCFLGFLPCCYLANGLVPRNFCFSRSGF